MTTNRKTGELQWQTKKVCHFTCAKTENSTEPLMSNFEVRLVCHTIACRRTVAPIDIYLYLWSHRALIIVVVRLSFVLAFCSMNIINCLLLLLLIFISAALSVNMRRLYYTPCFEKYRSPRSNIKEK